MLFSVVILSYNSSRTLEKCLNTLSSTLSQFNELSEVIVVENGSTDSSRAILKSQSELHKGLIKSILFDENTGTTRSRNAALDASTGQYVLVLDSDAYINVEALTLMKAYLDDNAHVGLVAPLLRYGDMRFQKSVDQFPTLVRKAQRFLSLEKMQSSEGQEERVAGPVDYAISACWLLTRDAVDASGGFDENIFYSPEDVDYCLQVWSAGYQVHYLPNAEAVHDAQELSRGFKITKFHLSHLKGLFYLFFKYKYFWGLQGLRKRIGQKV
jgi:GT2 family glycosyltransferase